MSGQGILHSEQMDITPQAGLLWKGIGGHFNNYMQIICEFLDNSIANLEDGNFPINMIHICVEEGEDHVLTSIEDTGSGIAKSDLERCITIGETPIGDNLRNEHGFGLKHALAASNPENDNWGIYTKCQEDIEQNHYRRVKAPYVYNISQETVDAGSIEWPGEAQYAGFSGTLVSFSSSTEMWNTVSSRPTRFSTLVERLIERIGYIYSTIISENRAIIRISSKPRTGDGLEHEPISAITPYWVEAYSPDPGSTEVDLGAGEVEFSYHFGKIRQSEEHNECYRTDTRQQGAEIRLNGRLIADSLFKEIWSKEPNPAYNHFRAIIDIKCNERGRVPPTLTHKDGFKQTTRYAALIRKIKEIFPDPPSEYTPATATENNLRDRVMELKVAHLQGNPTIEKELNVFRGLDADVKADMYIRTQDGNVIVYECKKDQTRVLDLYQLLMYWDGCVYDNTQPTEAILLASEHTNAVRQVVEYLNDMMDNNGVKYNFVLRTWNDEGVDYPTNPRAGD